MGYQVYQINGRWCGYGVPAYCDHPECHEEINRGLAYCCGGEPNSEKGCGLYFCEQHRILECFDTDGEVCSHTDDCDCECADVCERCAKKATPFSPKPDHPSWIKHILTDESWSQWRKENPEIVVNLPTQKD
jgi:hypothetical protein